MSKTHFSGINKPILCMLAVCLLLTLASCQNPLGEREYCDDLYIDIPDSESRLLIREWSYLLGSGAEVYFVSAEGEEPQLLGQIPGGDDGYCPFKDGKYMVVFSGNTVTLRWSFPGGDIYSQSERFDLPTSDP